MFSDCSGTVLSILSHWSLVTFELSCFCCYSLLQFFSYRFKTFGLDAVLPFQFIFFSVFAVLPSTFKPVLKLTQIFPGSCNILNWTFPVRFFTFFFVGNNTFLLRTNLAPALKRFFSSSKFFTLIFR